jgi:hypothetical protein
LNSSEKTILKKEKGEVMLVTKIKSLVTMLVVLSATSANANLYTVNDLTAPYSGSNYSTMTGTFNIASALNQSQFNKPFDITNGVLSFDFYAPSSWSSEAVSISVGGITQQWNAPATPQFSNVYQIVGYNGYSYSCGLFGMSTCYSSYPVYGYVNTFQGYTYGGSGSLTFAFSTTNNSSLLSALSNDGQLSYTAAFFGSPATLQSASLIANVMPNATPTPIPAAAWLFGSGLMGLAGVRRRLKK